MINAMAITVRQPWAWLIVNGIKDIENRTRRTSHRGPLLIHASQAKPSEEMLAAIEAKYHVTIPREELACGGVVGQANVVDVVAEHPSRWFLGPWGYVLTRAKPLPFVRCSGQLGIFRLQVP